MSHYFRGGSQTDLLLCHVKFEPIESKAEITILKTETTEGQLISKLYLLSSAIPLHLQITLNLYPKCSASLSV